MHVQREFLRRQMLMAQQKRRRSHGSRPTVRVRLVDDQFELVHPPCANERIDDIREVRQMLEAGEREVARDELRWLLEDCSDFLEAHVLLGRLAWEDGEMQLARGHFGYAYQVGRRALGHGFQGPLPCSRLANRPLFEAGAGLVRALERLNRRNDAVAVAREVLSWDRSDPMEMAKWLEKR
jgi:hypothetical protein